MKRKAVSGIMLALFLGIIVSVPTNSAEYNNLEWTSPELLVDNSMADGAASIIQDSDGKYWVAFSSGSNFYPQYHDVWIISSDDGVDWSVPIKITSSGDAVDPYLIQDASGNYLIAYIRSPWYPADSPSGCYGIWTMTSTDGIEWSTPISTGLGTKHSAGVSLFQDSTRKYWMSYCKHEQGNYRVMVSRSTDFINWDTPVQIYTSGFTPCLIQDSAGTYRVVWAGEALIWASTSNDGVTWSTPAPLSVNVTGFVTEPSLIQDTDGTYWLAWVSVMILPQPSYIFLSSSDDCVTWTAPQQLTTDIHGDYHPSLLQDSNGVYWVVWDSNRRNNWDIWYSNTILRLSTTVDVDPDTLNLKSRGEWVTAYIQLPEGYSAEDIDAATILLNETIQPVLDPKYDFVTNSSEYLVDYNEDGILERMVKFSRQDLIAILSAGEVTLTISGKVNDTPFEGTDTVRVIDG